MKKKTIQLIIIALIIIILISTYFLVDYLSNNAKINSLEKYKILDKEKIVKEFTYKNQNYLITTHYEEKILMHKSNIILKNNSDRLLIYTIKDCELSSSSTYIQDNIIYLHCLNKKGDIRKYTLKDYELEHEVIELDYSKVSNLSQYHILIDKIDKEYIYLYSHVTSSSKKSNKIKCSLDTKKCEYIK